MLPLNQHRAARLSALQADDGWLNLVARIPLGAGPQTVGSDSGNQLQLPSGPAHLGLLIPTDFGYEFQAEDGTRPFRAGYDVPPQLRVPPFLLEIHTADNQAALRVRDLTMPRRSSLTYFPDDPNWIIRACWVELAVPVPQSIDQKGGAAVTVSLSHTAQFTHQGRNVTLLATHWKAGKPMFVFRDATAGVETYAAARFLIGEDVGEDEITLDFNRAFTPPCGFTEFAICPLPPRENVLPFAIRAGEKKP